jgi:hypothetical protein
MVRRRGDRRAGVGLSETQAMISCNANETRGFCLFAACAAAILLIRDWAPRDPEKPRPVDIADRSTWRRPRRALAERVAMQFGYFMLTAASAGVVSRWLRVF